MNLFQYENYEVKITPEALLLKPFKLIYDRDLNSSKAQAKLELAYVYFMCDTRSNYMYLTDEEERSREIIESEGLGTWRPDATVKAACKFYVSFKSPSELLLEDVRSTIDKVRKFLRSVEMPSDGDLVAATKTTVNIVQAIKQVMALIKEVDEIERDIRKEAAEAEGRVRGQREKSILEDDITK